MKSTKMFFNGKRLKDIYVGATPWQVFKYKMYRFFRKVFIVSTLVGMVFISVKAGAYFNPRTITEVLEPVKTVPAIMKRIAKCESPNGHYSKTGQVSLGANTNKSVDIGKYQINNSTWGKKATAMGYNLMEEKDNEEFALWIYETRGTVDWYSSAKCWNK